MASSEIVPIAEMLEAYFAELPKGAQVRAARTVQVSAATMSKWRQGTQVPEEHRAPELAKILEKSEDEVVAAIALQRRQRPRPAVTDREELAEWRLSVEQNLDDLAEEIRKLSEMVRRTGPRRRE